MTLAEFKTALKKDKTVLGEPGYEESLFLGSAAQVGLEAAAISKFSHLPIEKCKTLRRLALRRGIFKNGELHHGGWFDKKSGGVAFYLDVAVLCGWLRRTDAK